MKNPKVGGGKVSESNFNSGFKIDQIELSKQRKHYGDHLKWTTNEIEFRDSKTAKSRKYAQYLNCTNPITSPKISLDGPTRRHYHVRFHKIKAIERKERANCSFEVDE